MTKQRIKLLEKSARVALASALAARKKLAAAAEAVGDVHIPMFLTSEEHRRIVREMRADHHRELVGLFAHVTNPDPKYMRIAQLSLHGTAEAAQRARRDALHVVKSGDASSHDTAADAIVRSGRRRRGED
ncbi:MULTISPECIES: hypothetical protein [unclassified Bradyrhizobium]|uniref:hypothetical protein n=1 Tax=unclassified Bradyrhizobium TaxID=2631580 RepID=UPI0028EFC3AA|nr:MULTISPECIES: hypothetical protein [unclassified Bradyrhizobium]